MCISIVVKSLEKRFSSLMDSLFSRHPLTGYVLLLTVMPIVVLAAVCIGTAILALPLSLVLESF